MTREVAVICWLCLAGSIHAQVDSARTNEAPWIEVMAGAYSPAGLAGIGFGVPCGAHFTPAIAGGYGTPEGGHLSMGLEYRAVSTRHGDPGVFGYWSYITGRHHGESAWEHTKVSEGQMLKFGASFAARAGNVFVALRGGYAWYTVQPIKVGPWAGHMGDNEPVELEGGILFSLSVRIPLGRGRVMAIDR